MSETGTRESFSRVYFCPVTQCAGYVPPSRDLMLVLKVSGDLQFGDGMLCGPFWMEVCSVMPVNSLHLMSFPPAVPMFLSWGQVSQCTKEDRQPGA